MQGDQVSLLQQYLARDISIYPEGKISGYYGALTKKAVSRFQDRYGLAYPKDPFCGLAGPKTRAKIMEVLGVSTESFITDLKKQIEILQAQITILLEKQKTKI
jgi:peptidoglycan hydrolase-like protein with peptidoglycan-binding domain